MATRSASLPRGGNNAGEVRRIIRRAFARPMRHCPGRNEGDLVRNEPLRGTALLDPVAQGGECIELEWSGTTPEVAHTGRHEQAKITELKSIH